MPLAPVIQPTEQGDSRYYKRGFNFGWVWQLQHKPRRQMYDRFMELFQPTETEHVLDLGVANLPEPLENIFEYYYPWKHRIVAAGVEDCRFLESRYSGLQFVQLEPGASLPFPDNHFDIAFCSATIEHVGSHTQQAAFLRELVRVSQRVYLTTPNRWYPIELHTRLPFVHWLPPKLFRWFLIKLGMPFYSTEENLNLLSGRQLKNLVSNPSLRVRLTHQYFFGLPSNLILTLEKIPSSDA
jgi:hypothetical protein